MPIKRQPIDDLSITSIQPKAEPQGSFFVASPARVSGGRTDWGELLDNAGKLIGKIGVQNREEDIAQGERLLQENQNDINDMLSKQESQLSGFAKLVSLDKLAEEHSPGQVIGYRRAAGRLLANSFTMNAQRALDDALNQEYKIDPDTTVPTAKVDPAAVLLKTEQDFIAQTEQGSAKWLLEDYYGGQVFNDLKSKASTSLLSEYSQRFDEKQKLLHRDMIASEGVQELIRLNGLVDMGQIDKEQARLAYEDWITKRVYLGSIKNPSEFITAVIAVATQEAQNTEQKRINSDSSAIPSEVDPGLSLFNRFRDLNVGTAPLSQSQGPALTKLETQLIQDNEQSIARSNQLYSLKRTKELNNYTSNPEGIHVKTLILARSDEYKARKELELQFNKDLAAGVPFAEDKYNITLQSLEKAVNSTPDMVDDLQSESDALKILREGDANLARDIADFIDNPEIRVRTFNKISQLEQTNLSNALKNPLIKSSLKELEKFSGARGLKAAGINFISDDASAEELALQDLEDISTLEETLRNIALKKLPNDAEITEMKNAVDAVKARKIQRYKEYKAKDDELLKPIYQSIENNIPADEKITELFEEGKIGQRGYAALVKLNAKTKFLPNTINSLLDDAEINRIIDRTFKLPGIRGSALSSSLITNIGKDQYLGTPIYQLSPEGLDISLQLKKKSAEETADFFRNPVNSNLLKDPIIRESIIKDRFTKTVRNKLLNYLATLPDVDSKELIKQSYPSIFNPNYFDKDIPDNTLRDVVETRYLNQWDSQVAVPKGVSLSKLGYRLKNLESFKPDDWREFNNNNIRGDYDPILFRDSHIGRTFIDDKGLGNPRYMLEVGLQLDNRDWKVAARQSADLLSLGAITSEYPDTKKEEIIAYVNTLTGIKYSDIIDGKYSYGGKQIDITRYNLINWKVTPLFASIEDMANNYDRVKDNLFKKLNIDSSQEEAFKLYQAKAVGRL